MNICRFAWTPIALLLAYSSASGASAEAPESFRRQCAELAQNAEKQNSMAVAGREGWLFLAGELRHIGAGKFWGEAAPRVSRAAKPEIADPLPAILDFNDQLKKIGVQLILVPVPPKAMIYPEMLPGTNRWNGAARLDAFHQEFYALLRSKGINVLDLAEFFLQNKNHSRGAVYCRQDSHWSGNACALAAGKIAGQVLPILDKDKEISAKPQEALGRATASGRAAAGRDALALPFQEEWQEVEISGDLWQALNQKDLPREKLSIRKISGPGASAPVESDPESAVILLGDSHNLVFHAGEDMQAQGAGLPDQLAFELGKAVDLVAVRGSGATPARINLMRRAGQKKNYWANKKCVIWCFAAREFTESDGWRLVPIYKEISNNQTPNSK